MAEKASSPSAYLDANVFIDFVEGEPTLAKPLEILFKIEKGASARMSTSELTLAEALAPSRIDGPRHSGLKRQHLNSIAWNASISLRPVSRGVLLETVELQRFTRHKLPDAIHCVTAVQAGCKSLMSRDSEMKRLPEGMTYLTPDATGVSKLIEVFGV